MVIYIMPHNEQFNGASFLHQQNKLLNASPDVEHSVAYLRAHGELIADKPADRIEAYLGLLAHTSYVNDGLLTGDRESIERQIASTIIAADEVPESYFKAQKEIAWNQGHGRIIMTAKRRRLLTEAAQQEQTASLESWIDYLTGDRDLPAWFRVYAFEGIKKMSDLDKEKGEFRTRSKGTVLAYPELNPEALAIVYDNITDEDSSPNQLPSLSFSKLYASALSEVVGAQPERKESLEGDWSVFPKSRDPETGKALANAIKGHNTGWCVRGVKTAQAYVTRGDFRVYFTPDADGELTIPRLAIAMNEYGEVSEVRGILKGQIVEPELFETAKAMTLALPGGDKYEKKLDTLQQLMEIDQRLGPKGKPSAEDLYFLRYQYNHAELGQVQQDPRVSRRLNKRNETEDMSTIVEHFGHYKVAEKLMEDMRPDIVLDNLELLTTRPSERRYYLTRIRMDFDIRVAPSIAKNLHKIEGVTSIQQGLIVKDLYEYDRWLGLGNWGVEALINNVEKFTLGVVDLERLYKHILKSDNGYGHSLVIKNLEKFPPEIIDRTAFAQYLLDSGKGDSLVADLPKFELDETFHRALAAHCFESKNSQRIEIWLKNFRGLDYAELKKHGVGASNILANLDSLAPETIDSNDLIAGILDICRTHPRTIENLVATLPKLRGVDSAVGRLLTYRGFEEAVSANPDTFSDTPAKRIARRKSLYQPKDSQRVEYDYIAIPSE
jgi:hypothetical protein